MEINISQFFNTVNPMDLSASAAEMGDNASRITWQASIDSAQDDPPLILQEYEEKDAFRMFVRESGGWTWAEIEAWTDEELEALCRQWIAGDMREPVGFELGPDTTSEQWEDYQQQTEEGNASGRIFKGDNGEVWWSMY